MALTNVLLLLLLLLMNMVDQACSELPAQLWRHWCWDESKYYQSVYEPASQLLPV